MASGDSRVLPAYVLGDWPPKVRHALVTPGTRWRVFIEDLEDVEHDVILNTVLRIRQAGETDASRIADLLQLPEDLIRYLLSTANQQRLAAAKAESGIVALRAKVGWVYRDMASGELWPQPGEQVAPIEIRYSGSFRGRFEFGTAGDPLKIEALLLDTRESTRPEPSAVELARFSRSTAMNRRTAVISSGEPCLVISPVAKDKSGLAVLTTQDTPHLSLGRLLNASVEQYESVANWAKGIPLSTAASQQSALALVIQELTDLLAHLASSATAAVSNEHFTSLLELTLSRWVDHYRFMFGLAQPDGQLGDESRAVAERYALNPNTTRVWAIAPRSDARRKVVELLAKRMLADDPLLRDVSVVTDRYDSTVGRAATLPELVEMAKQITHVGRLLLDRERGEDGQAEA